MAIALVGHYEDFGVKENGPVKAGGLGIGVRQVSRIEKHRFYDQEVVFVTQS